MSESGRIDKLIVGETYRLQDDSSNDPALLKPFRQRGFDRAKVVEIYVGTGVSVVSFRVENADGQSEYSETVALFVGKFLLHYRKICEQKA